MRKSLFTLLACFSLSTAAADNVIISGYIPTIPDGAIALLFQTDGRVGTSIATDTVNNGKFRLSATVDSIVCKMNVSIYPGDHFSLSRDIYVRPGAEIKIIGKDDLSVTWEVTSNVPEQAEYDSYMHKSKDLIGTLQQLRNENYKLAQSAKDKENRTKAKEEYDASKPYRDSLKYIVDNRDIEIMKRTQVSQVWLDKMEEKVRGLSLTWNDTVNSIMKKFYDGLNDTVKASKQGIRIGKLLYPEPIIEVEDMFPDVKFYDLDGKEHLIQEMLGKWSVVVLWTVGCGGCHYAVQEMPKFLDKHQGELNGVLLSIDSDKTWRSSCKMFDIHGNNWNEGVEDVGLFQRLGAKGTPTIVMVTPEGKVADIFLGFYTDRIEATLKKNLE